MILFSCEHCSHKIGVQDKHAGKRGKCPECGNVIVIPAKSTIIEFRCKRCGQKISVPQIHTGKKAKCPKCKKIVIVPARIEVPAKSISTVRFTCSMCNREIEEPETSRGKLVECPHCGCYAAVPSEKMSEQEAEASLQPGTEDDTSDERFEKMQKGQGRIARREPETVVERKLPWLIDIFLYPTSRPSLAILGIAAVVRVVFRIVVRFLGRASQQFLPFLAFFGFMWGVGMIVRIILYLYVWWYLCECIRDSSSGGIRAPETTGHSPGLGGMLWQAFSTSGCFLFFLGPAFFYSREAGETDTIFWCLAAYGVFFFPISLLAVVLFGSWRGLNPIVLIGSIFSTFLPYCAMIVVIAAFIAAGIFIVGKLPNPQQSSLGLFIVWCMSIYLAMIVAHLLGAFYHRYEQQLNWDV